MKIIWLGHGSFRIEIEDQVLLIDPWLEGNPVLPENQHAAATEDATYILVTHGHFDHTTSIPSISADKGIPVAGMYELVTALQAAGAHEDSVGFNMGGTISIGDVKVSLVPASHSSSMAVDDNPRYMGNEAGFIIQGEGHTIYHSGDTGIMADMDWIGDYYRPDIGILSAGGHFTMDMRAAAYAARRYFDFKAVIPCHYKTFPLLEDNAEALIDGLRGVQVIEPQVMVPIEV